MGVGVTMTTIELAPDYKRSLTLNNPIIFAGGGYGNFSDIANIGAIVTLPTTLRPRTGAPLPRVIEIPGGVLVRTGAANPGLTHVLRSYRRIWEQSTIPVIVAFASQGMNDWATMAAQFDSVVGVGGIELHFNPLMNVVDAIRAVRASTELPILAKLDLDNAVAVAADCAAAGANTLVIGRAPRGMALVNNKPWYGRLFGPTVKPIALRAVAEIVDLKLNVPIIASGGIHSTKDVRDLLNAGACAVEIDSALWIEPTIATRIANEMMS